jgi:hypothetical protein
MATLNNTMATLVDNLHQKMTSNTPLDAQEQTLIATAINSLSDQTNWTPELIALAEQQFDASTDALSQTLTTQTDGLSGAQTAITGAKDNLQSQNANLALLSSFNEDVGTALNTFGDNNSAKVASHMAAMPRPVFGLVPIETPQTVGSNARSLGIFAIYDASGETFAVRPCYDNSYVGQEVTRMEFVKVLVDGSGQSVIASHYVNSTQHYVSPSTFTSFYGNSAIVPLGIIADPNDIDYEVVYSMQGSNSPAAVDYAGVYCRSAGHYTMTKPTLNRDATDQWGIRTVTAHYWMHVAILYDNNKHCLVMVDESSSLLVEKYRDGNVVTSTSINSNDEYQSYVDSGDFTVVYFINNQMPLPVGTWRMDGILRNLSASRFYDCYGFFGIVDGQTRMAGNSYNAHYRFTSDKKLEPLNYFFNGTTTHHHIPGTSGADGAVGDLNVTIEDMQGTILGSYHYQSKADGEGGDAGFMAAALMCMNPYSHVGLLNDYAMYMNGPGHEYANMTRTCRAF